MFFSFFIQAIENLSSFMILSSCDSANW